MNVKPDITFHLAEALRHMELAEEHLKQAVRRAKAVGVKLDRRAVVAEEVNDETKAG